MTGAAEAARKLAALGGAEPDVKDIPRRRPDVTDYVAIVCRDKPDSAEIRQANRPAHLDFARAAPFPIAAAGPLLAQDGETMIGSLIVVQSGDLQAVRDWAAGDPYAKAGLFESVSITSFKHLLGQGLPRGAAETSHG